ncbi:MAG: transglycosylase SLT domain-containing protein, partial [Oligoflexia bacterium]|nr:transglycosylase SLT domain-containing protein [Oligoflexia bacterium]
KSITGMVIVVIFVFISIAGLTFTSAVNSGVITVSSLDSSFDPTLTTMTSFPSWEEQYYSMRMSSGLRVAPYFGTIHFWDLDTYSLQQLEKIAIKSIPPNMRKDFAKLLPRTLKLTAKYDIDPLWVLSIMWVESQYRTSIQSPAGARGPMQLMPSTGSFLLSSSKASEPSLKIGPPYRKELIQAALGQKKIVEARKSLTKKRKSKSSVTPSTASTATTKTTAMAPSTTTVTTHNNNDPYLNIEMGIVYLKYLLETFESPILATVAYNMGPNWVKQRLEKKLPVGLDNQYLRKVKEIYEIFSKGTRPATILEDLNKN